MATPKKAIHLNISILPFAVVATKLHERKASRMKTWEMGTRKMGTRKMGTWKMQTRKMQTREMGTWEMGTLGEDLEEWDQDLEEWDQALQLSPLVWLSEKKHTPPLFPEVAGYARLNLT